MIAIVMIILILFFILLFFLLRKFIRWLKTPTYWHQVGTGWYGTGHPELTEKDNKWIRDTKSKRNKKL